MDKEFWVIVYRTFLVLFILFLLAKLMGKKQVSQLNLFDYIVGITIGSIAADISLDIDKDLITGIASIVIYGVLSFVISILSMKSITIRRLFCGVPTVLMEHGKIIERGLKKCRIDVNDLLEEARSQGYFKLDDIDYAVMESTGKVSFLLKDDNSPVTKKDMKLKTKNEGLVANVVIDEEIMINNLISMNKDREWLLKQLKVLGYNSSSGILLATLDSNDKVVVYDKNVKAEKASVLE